MLRFPCGRAGIHRSRLRGLLGAQGIALAPVVLRLPVSRCYGGDAVCLINSFLQVLVLVVQDCNSIAVEWVSQLPFQREQVVRDLSSTSAIVVKGKPEL